MQCVGCKLSLLYVHPNIICKSDKEVVIMSCKDNTVPTRFSVQPTRLSHCTVTPASLHVLHRNIESFYSVSRLSVSLVNAHNQATTPGLPCVRWRCERRQVGILAGICRSVRLQHVVRKTTHLKIGSMLPEQLPSL